MAFRVRVFTTLAVFMIIAWMFINEAHAQVTFSRDWNPGKRGENPDYHNAMKTASAVCHLLILSVNTTWRFYYIQHYTTVKPNIPSHFKFGDRTMFNFLDPKLMPKVSCSAPATDNFEVSNLISDKEALRARGFLAYTVIKPPIEIEFELLCPVEAAFITLQTTVGRQKCTGIEVFARNAASTYVSIARAVYDKSGVTFCNSRKYSLTQPPEGHDPSNALFFFKRDTIRVFSDISFLKIVIFRTEKSVPCLGAVKLLGQAAKNCSDVTIKTIDRLMGARGNSQNPKVVEKAKFKVPEDFIDDLTCEIMAIPMTLPSGKTVDRDTLEKHVENEKSFGRKPCDPFTGLKFNASRKPVMNVALKSRIDMFLMQHASNPELFGVKRTIGSNNADCKRQKCDVKCSVCSGKQNLYVIPCCHFYCRDCLLMVTVWKCKTCQEGFSRSSATKYHN